MYQFKFYYNDGTTSQTHLKCNDPKQLYNNFDGFMDWEKFYELEDKNLSTYDIVKYAFELYKQISKKDYYRIEIVNDQTNEVVDYYELSKGVNNNGFI